MYPLAPSLGRVPLDPDPGLHPCDAPPRALRRPVSCKSADPASLVPELPAHPAVRARAPSPGIVVPDPRAQQAVSSADGKYVLSYVRACVCVRVLCTSPKAHRALCLASLSPVPPALLCLASHCLALPSSCSGPRPSIIRREYVEVRSGQAQQPLNPASPCRCPACRPASQRPEGAPSPLTDLALRPPRDTCHGPRSSPSPSTRDPQPHPPTLSTPGPSAPLPFTAVQALTRARPRICTSKPNRDTLQRAVRAPVPPPLPLPPLPPPLRPASCVRLAVRLSSPRAAHLFVSSRVLSISLSSTYTTTTTTKTPSLDASTSTADLPLPSPDPPLSRQLPPSRCTSKSLRPRTSTLVLDPPPPRCPSRLLLSPPPFELRPFPLSSRFYPLHSFACSFAVQTEPTTPATVAFHFLPQDRTTSPSSAPANRSCPFPTSPILPVLSVRVLSSRQRRSRRVQSITAPCARVRILIFCVSAPAGFWPA